MSTLLDAVKMFTAEHGRSPTEGEIDELASEGWRAIAASINAKKLRKKLLRREREARCRTAITDSRQ